MDDFIQKQTENGWLDALEAKWFSKKEPTTTPMDLSQLSGENGVLRVATNAESIPFSYLKAEGLCGLDLDFIFKFAMEYGYALDIHSMSFSAILPGLKTEKYDLALCGLTVTEESKESVLFSEPYYTSPIVMAVLDRSSDGSQWRFRTLSKPRSVFLPEAYTTITPRVASRMPSANTLIWLPI
jgi:polar amino acid transport system substrate-binding protein